MLMMMMMMMMMTMRRRRGGNTGIGLPSHIYLDYEAQRAHRSG